jgi:hypothetical protein
LGRGRSAARNFLIAKYFVNGVNDILDADLRFNKITICAKLLAAETLVIA